jgi:hypothetical protein
MWASFRLRMALGTLTFLMLPGAAPARTEVPYTLAGGFFTGGSDDKREPSYVVADNGVGRYEASLNLSAWTTQLSATVVGTMLEEAPPDAYTIDSAYAFAILADNFVITDLDNPLFTGSLDTGLWLNIRASGSLFAAGSLGGGATFEVLLFDKTSPMPYAAGGYSWRLDEGGYHLIPELGPDSVGPGFSGPAEDPSDGNLNFNGVMSVNLCDPHCPNLGEPFYLYMYTSVGAYGASTGPGNTPSVADASFGSTFSIGFSWDDPELRLSIASTGGYVNPVPLPPAVWLMVSALAAVVGQSRLAPGWAERWGGGSLWSERAAGSAGTAGSLNARAVAPGSGRAAVG